MVQCQIQQVGRKFVVDEVPLSKMPFHLTLFKFIGDILKDCTVFTCLQADQFLSTINPKNLH